MPEARRDLPAAPATLGGLRFEALRLDGLGSPMAPMGHALAWFDGHLYLSLAAGPGTPARIFRRDGATGTWSTVFESHETDTPVGPAPRECGIRAMTVFQGSTDTAPCLYCGTISVTGGQILRSADGISFTPAPPQVFGAPALGGFTVFGPWLAALPLGASDQTGLHPDNAAIGTVPQVAQNPGAGFWTPADELARTTGWHTDPANLAVAALAVAHGALYAATTNPTRGFELWRTTGQTTAPFHWEKVLDRGAGRFAESPSVAAMAEFDGDLWIGTESQVHDDPDSAAPVDTGHLPAALRDRLAARRSSPAEASTGAELIRLRADGSWDLIIGVPRFTPSGLKVPLAALGPGFGDTGQSAIAALAVHDGHLFAGTRQARPRAAGTPPRAMLWCSDDGMDWQGLPIADQAGETDCMAVESLCSTPEGLVASLRRDVAAGLSGWAGASLPGNGGDETLADEAVLLWGWPSS